MIETENFFLLEMLQLEPVRQTFFWRRGASCCSSKAKKSWLSSFTQRLLSLVLMVGLLGTLFSILSKKEASPEIHSCAYELASTDSFFSVLINWN